MLDAAPWHTVSGAVIRVEIPKFVLVVEDKATHGGHVTSHSNVRIVKDLTLPLASAAGTKRRNRTRSVVRGEQGLPHARGEAPPKEPKALDPKALSKTSPMRMPPRDVITLIPRPPALIQALAVQ